MTQRSTLWGIYAFLRQGEVDIEPIDRSFLRRPSREHAPRISLRINRPFYRAVSPCFPFYQCEEPPGQNMLRAENPMKLSAIQSPYDLLRTLWHKEVYLQTDQHQFKGRLVFVSKMTPTGTPYVSVEDILVGKQKVVIKTIVQVWFRNKCLWRASRFC